MSQENNGNTIYELTNEQRKYFGIAPIPKSWERQVLPETSFRGAGVAYFDGDILRRVITSAEQFYSEYQYELPTTDKTWILPKTSKGKPVRLSLSTVERQIGAGNYVRVGLENEFRITNYSSDRTFYSSQLECPAWMIDGSCKSARQLLEKYIATCTPKDLQEVAAFASDTEKRRQRAKSGDVFAMKLSRDTWGFGRVLTDMHAVFKAGLMEQFLMTHPLLVQAFAYTSDSPDIDIEKLLRAPRLGSCYMQDNEIFYGTFPIIGHLPVGDDEYDFPITERDYMCSDFMWGEFAGSLSKWQRRGMKSDKGRSGRVVSYPYDLPKIETAKQSKQDVWYQDEDLRSPARTKDRQKIVRALIGIRHAPDITYAGACQRLGRALPAEVFGKF